MQVDMHYYGTYAVARIAGFQPDLAKTIATAAQFVDEAVAASPINLGGQGYLLPVVSAHDMLELGKNFDQMDQWNVWVPFHFLPGGAGNTAEERLTCLLGEPGNTGVDEIISMTLETGADDERHSLHLLGIISHVIQDTYSHYGFSGVASDLNEIDQTSLEALNTARLSGYVSRKVDTFFERVAASFAEASRLGHAGAATFPDRPYLEWNFNYENEGHPDVPYIGQARDNKETFMLACTRLHAVFDAFLKGHRSLTQPHLPFGPATAQTISNILAFEGKKDERCEMWQEAIASGSLFPNLDSADENLDYSSKGWGIRAMKGNPLAVTTEAYLYHRAANQYLEKVHNSILPDLEILIG